MSATDKTVTGMVLWSMGNRARILISNDQVIVDVPGKWRLDGRGVRPLAPGDHVSLHKEGETWRLLELIPRTNEFTRRTTGPKSLPQVIAANLDYVLIIAAVAEPKAKTGLIDRFLVTAAIGDVKPVLIFNKIDLVTQDELTSWRELYQGAVDTIIFTSAVTGEGVDEMSALITGNITLLAGASGVGKSTLANMIDPKLDIKTTHISQATGKGKHTTSSSELYRVSPGGWLTDTPGLRECAPWGMTRHNLVKGFPEIARLMDDCRFRDCRHHTEVGCAVTEAVGSGDIPEKRYRSYLKLLAEAET